MHSATRSIRFRITAPTVLLVVVLLAGLSYLLVESVRVHLISQVDAELVNGAHYVQQEIGHGVALPAVGPRGTYGQFLLPDGKLIGSSANLEGIGPLVRSVSLGTNPRLTTISTRQFGELRVLEQQLGGRSAPILVEAQQIDQIADATRSLEERLAVGAPILALIFGALIWFVVGRAMKPVEATRLAVAGIADLANGERVENPGTGDELERLVTTMNLLLDRLQASFEREQQFVSDASHELRSPIAAVRAILESEALVGTEQVPPHASALEALQRLQDVADQLLILDRSNDSRRDPRPVDVDEWVLAVAQQLRQTTSLAVDTRSVSAGQVLATEIDIMRIVDNLASNAARYARSTLKFSLSEEQGWVRIEVEDDGPGIPADMQSIVFERFSRLNDDRSSDEGGAGLGLAIVRELADRHGGSIHVISKADTGASFIVLLPSAR
jgi:signal transduction histidine kinase